MSERKRNADGTFRKKRKSGLGAAEDAPKRRRRRVASAIRSKSPQYIDGAIVGGLLLASVARGVLGKVMPTAAAGTGVNTSGLIVDLAITGAGVFLAGSSQNELLKYAGYGVAANGVAGAIKNVTGKDLLSPALSGIDINEVISGLGFGDAGQDINGLAAAQMIDLNSIPIAPSFRGIGAPDDVSGLAAYEDVSGVGAVNLYSDMGDTEI